MTTNISMAAPKRHIWFTLGPWRFFAPRHGDWGFLGMVGKTEADGKPDLRELLRAVGENRDVAAYEVLFRHFAPRVKSYMIRLAGDGQQAEELMQETMIAVWNKADQFDPSRGAVSTWIFTIARNLRVDAFRRGRRPDFDPHDPAFIPEDVLPADVEVEVRQASEQLHSALATLPEEQLTLLKLSFFQDNSHSEIAAGLNLPLGTVKSRMRLAFARLRAALEKSGDAS